MPKSPICPKCKTNDSVCPKLILIGEKSPRALFSEERAGYQRKDQLATDECKSELLKEPPLEQFIEGYFCHKCGQGFVESQILTKIE